jgi:hypothetical protein
VLGTRFPIEYNGARWPEFSGGGNRRASKGKP